MPLLIIVPSHSSKHSPECYTKLLLRTFWIDFGPEMWIEPRFHPWSLFIEFTCSICVCVFSHKMITRLTELSTSTTGMYVDVCSCWSDVAL